MSTDYYELLGVPRDADAVEIKKAYRGLARELHPDATAGNAELTERFKAVSKAYEVLSDPEQRARYDRFGPEGVSGGADFGAMNVEDIFSMFFGGDNPFGFGTRQPSGPPRGADLEAVAEVEMSDVIVGCQRTVDVRTAVSCESCGGSGAEPPSAPAVCDDCDGTGQIRMVRQTLLGQMVSSGPCRRCGGVGQRIDDPCLTCRGEGRVVENRSLTIEVPAGVDDGTTLRLTGRGAVGPRGGPPGDLYIHLRVARHPVYRREGSHLLADLHVSLTQAALGASVELVTFDDVAEISVPRGTQTGRVVRLRGLGVPALDGRGRGDIAVTLVVDTPTDLDERSEELLRELAAHRGEDVADHPAGMFDRLRSAFKGG